MSQKPPLLIVTLVTILIAIAGSVLFSLKINKEVYYPENQIEHTSLVKATTTDPKTLAWNEANWNQRIDLPGNFSIYDQGVHWNDRRLVGADSNTFVLYDENYAHDSDAVYYQGFTSGSGNEDVFIIQGADIASFRPLSLGYAKDKYHAYFRGEEIIDADQASFEVLGQDFLFYARDKDFIYEQNKKIEGISAVDFRIIENSSIGAMYFADREKVLLHAWFEDGGGQREFREVEGADPESFVALVRPWGKDKYSAFYGAHRILSSDPDSFEILGAGDGDFQDVYAKDKTGAYYQYKRIEGVDAESFRVVQEFGPLSGVYAEDKNRAYRNGEVFPKQDLVFLMQWKLPPSAKSLGSNYYLYQNKVYQYSLGGHEPRFLDLVEYADPATFDVLKNGYARDEKRIFLGAAVVSDDPATFEMLPNMYSKDSQGVYFESSKIVDADPSSFSLIANSGYSKDKDSIFFNPYSEVKKVDADPASFKLVAGGRGDYGMDAKHVFLEEKIIESALPETFEYLESGYAKDGKTVYYFAQKIDADLGTFTVFGDGLTSELGYQGSPVYMSYAKDKDKVFCGAEIIENADPKTFTLKGKNGMPQDKTYRYDRCGVSG